jgi:hypothetical protein
MKQNLWAQNEIAHDSGAYNQVYDFYLLTHTADFLVNTMN